MRIITMRSNPCASNRPSLRRVMHFILGGSRAYVGGAGNQAVRYCRTGQSSMVGKPNPRPPSGEASQHSRPPKTDSFKQAKSEPAIDKLAMIQFRPSIPGTSMLLDPLLVINSYRHRG